MQLKGILSLCAAIVAAVALVAVSGASAAKATRTAHIDVSTRSGVVDYLRSMHMQLKHVVIQRGARNYAGPRCPGKRWSCTNTTRTVVQIAKGSGKNVFRCATARCAVVQISKSALASNQGTCIKTTGVTQSCTISQPNATGTNKAVVWMDTGKLTGLTQTALYTASITQGPASSTGASNTNLACVHQAVFIDGSTNNTKSSGATVTNEAHQSISITQNSRTGSNMVQNAKQVGSSYDCDATTPLSQNQTLTSTATSRGLVVQKQNAADNGPNLTLDIEQNQGSDFLNNANVTGLNTVDFKQTTAQTAIANTPAGATQIQTSPSGGVLAAVNQYSTGMSTANAVQRETQCEDADRSGLSSCETNAADAPTNYPLTQIQYGPAGVAKSATLRHGRHFMSLRKAPGDSSQTGNPGDTFTVSQTTTQDNDTQSDQKNTVASGFHTDGAGSANQTANIDGSTTNQSQSGSDVSVVTNCTGPTCFTESGHQLTATNTDVAEFGYGGMRVNTGAGSTPGDGTGSITVSGIGGAVTKALLYWNGPTSSSDPNSNAAVSFGGTPITGTNIGTAASNCWNRPDLGVAYTNSQSYRADVTDLVKNGLVGGSGTFALSNFVKTDGNNNVVSDINGVSLIVFSYDGQSANYRNVVLWSGNDSNEASTNDPAGWDETLTGVPYPGSGNATLDFVVGDGQTFTDGAVTVNGTEVVPEGGNFDGNSTPAGPANASGDLWDVKSYALPPTLLAGLSTTQPNTLQLTSPLVNDCLSLVVAAANMPATAQSFASAAAPTRPVGTTAARLPAASVAAGASAKTAGGR